MPPEFDPPDGALRVLYQGLLAQYGAQPWWPAETAFARMVAERYHTDHFEKVVASDDFELLDTLAWLYDEPYADSSAIPTYRVCELARKHVTVALSGW